MIWVDVHISPAVAKWIAAELGHPALSVRDLGLRNAKDKDIFAAAGQAQAIVMTKDADFLVAKNHSSAGRVVGQPERCLAGRGCLRVAGVLQVSWQPLGDVLRVLYRQLLQSIPYFRDCAHAKTLGSPTRFAKVNYPGGIWQETENGKQKRLAAFRLPGWLGPLPAPSHLGHRSLMTVD